MGFWWELLNAPIPEPDEQWEEFGQVTAE